MPYTETDIQQIVAAQRTFFRSGATLDIRWRIQQLKALKAAVIAHEEAFLHALHEDLGRTPVEAYLCDVGPLIVEINEMIRGLRRWARPEHHFSGLMCFPSLTTKVYKMPMGAYHGEWGFREFTHPSTVLIGQRHFNLPLRQHPYGGKAGEKKLSLLRKMEK